MSFTSPSFLAFLGVTLAAYFVAPRRVRWCVLLAGSFVFYWFLGSWFALGMIALTTMSVFGAGLWAAKLREAKASKRMRRLPLLLCLLLNFGLLFLLRYSGAFFPALGSLMIPGISFYTFQAAGYLIDVYKGKQTPTRNPLRFALFLSFFPQLIQGPISRYGSVADDLFAGHGWDWDRARGGVQRILWGYFMQFVIANLAAVPAQTIFADYFAFGGATILLGVFCFILQTYASFAGGIYIAIGLGEIVGVQLHDNFRQPFFARSLTDFWRRWHISLNTWLRDYLFYPLAISKPLTKLGNASRRALGAYFGKIIPVSISTFLVYFIMGVWHGITLPAVVFGLLNSGLITLSLFCEPLIAKLRAKTKLDGNGGAFGTAFAMLRTFGLLTVLRYFTLSDSVRVSLSMLKRTLLHPQISGLWNGALANIGLGTQELVLLAFGALLLLLRDILAEHAEAHGSTAREKLNKAAPILQFALTFAVVALIAYCGIYREGYIATEFVYAQF